MDRTASEAMSLSHLIILQLCSPLRCPFSSFRHHDLRLTIRERQGTTLQGPTSKKDKYNDNLYALMFISHPIVSLTVSQDSSHAAVPA